MIDSNQIREHMEVLDNAGQHVGTVDHLDNGRIKLTKSDPTSGGEHHFVDLNLADRVENGALHLSVPAAQARGHQA
jgi:hypothetical protein